MNLQQRRTFSLTRITNVVIDFFHGTYTFKFIQLHLLTYNCVYLKYCIYLLKQFLVVHNIFFFRTCFHNSHFYNVIKLSTLYTITCNIHVYICYLWLVYFKFVLIYNIFRKHLYLWWMFMANNCMQYYKRYLMKLFVCLNVKSIKHMTFSYINWRYHTWRLFNLGEHVFLVIKNDSEHAFNFNVFQKTVLFILIFPVTDLITSSVISYWFKSLIFLYFFFKAV